MSADDPGFNLTLEQLVQTYKAIADVRRQHPNASPEWYAILREGGIDHARQLQRQIEEYLEFPSVEADAKSNGVTDTPGDGGRSSTPAQTGRAAS